MQTRGWGGGGEGTHPYLFLLKGRTKGTSDQLQVPFDDQPWNEMQFNRLYEGIWGTPLGT